MEIETGSQTHISQECGHTHTERLRCRSADVFWISVLLLLLGEELLGESVFAYVCAAAAIRFTEGGERAAFESSLQDVPARGWSPLVAGMLAEWRRTDGRVPANGQGIHGGMFIVARASSVAHTL